jgi:hypothetical protein
MRSLDKDVDEASRGRRNCEKGGLRLGGADRFKTRMARRDGFDASDCGETHRSAFGRFC